MNTRQLLSVGIDIGTTTTQVIFSHLELVNRAAVSQVPRYEFIKREISWQSPVFFTPVDKQDVYKRQDPSPCGQSPDALCPGVTGKPPSAHQVY